MENIMAATQSSNVPLGSSAIDFELIDVLSNKNRTLTDLKSEIATVIMFICNHCPYVKHINRELVRLTDEYMTKGISFIAINSNDVENYPEDSPDNMKKTARQHVYNFPYLFDVNQEVARAYSAACTPEFYVYDSGLKLVYHGQFDDSRPGNTLKTDGKDMRIALDNLIAGRSVDTLQKPSIGCNIKWKY